MQNWAAFQSHHLLFFSYDDTEHLRSPRHRASPDRGANKVMELLQVRGLGGCVPLTVIQGRRGSDGDAQKIKMFCDLPGEGGQGGRHKGKR